MSNARGRTGLYAGIAAVALTVGVGAAGSAGADGAADANVYARETGNGLCFSTNPGSDCPPNESAEVAIAPGETVTWHFDGSVQPHNAADATAPVEWQVPESGLTTTGSYPRVFAQEGVYPFICQAHPQMKGTVTVGDPPDPDPAPSPSPSPIPTPPPSGGGHVHTPAPTGGQSDTVKPTVASVKLTAGRRSIRVRFRLSESATVTIKVKRSGSRRVLKSTRVQAPAGLRSVTLRSSRLKRGRYTVEIQARDAVGNRSSVARRRVALRR
jgi:plastocyanin